MSDLGVAAFTDTYLPTVNGVTYTVQTWRDRWAERGGRMSVVYPEGGHDPADGEHPVRSLPFPFYEGFRVGVPRIPDELETPDVVHAHTPFSIGLAGLHLARSLDAPLVASYHTPTAEYASYLSINGTVEKTVRGAANAYERWYLDRADAVVVPSPETGRHVREDVGVDGRIEVVPNGVETDFFRPVEGDFRERYGLPEGPLIGYTGRHGFEKNLDVLIEAVAGLERDATLVFGGDGPARPDLEAAADAADIDAHFLGFLDREDLPAFYSALDVFAFPSPVETQGLVALEATACGTPVAAVDAGALRDTVLDGETGYTAPADDVAAFRNAICRTLDAREEMADRCLARRDAISVDHAVDRIGVLYQELLNGT